MQSLRQFAAERIDQASREAPFRRPSFRASYTCPYCGIANEYTSEDMIGCTGTVEGDT